MIALIFAFLLQTTDTLSQVYSEKWHAQEQALEKADGLVGLLASHDLAFVVFGVVLIILITLFTYLFRLDKKLSAIEKKLNL